MTHLTTLAAAGVLSLTLGTASNAATYTITHTTDQLTAGGDGFRAHYIDLDAARAALTPYGGTVYMDSGVLTIRGSSAEHAENITHTGGYYYTVSCGPILDLIKTCYRWQEINQGENYDPVEDFAKLDVQVGNFPLIFRLDAYVPAHFEGYYPEGSSNNGAFYGYYGDVEESTPIPGGAFRNLAGFGYNLDLFGVFETLEVTFSFDYSVTGATPPTTTPAVPLPAGLPLIASGLAALGLLRRQRG